MRDTLTGAQRDALARHGYDPDLPPNGAAGPPQRIRGFGGKMLRPHVCMLDGIEIDGHQESDLWPGEGCIFGDG